MGKTVINCHDNFEHVQSAIAHDSWWSNVSVFQLSSTITRLLNGALDRSRDQDMFLEHIPRRICLYAMIADKLIVNI